MSILLKEGIFWGVSAILAVYWLIKFAQLFYRRRIDPFLGTEPGKTPAAPLVSIIIAVRDEERNIEDCIRSFQKQTYPNWEMIIVDDRSRDRTAKIVERLRDGDPRIRLIKNTENPPPDWSAQVYANGKGVTESRGEWLVFTDADTRHHPAHLRSALVYCLQNRATVLTILPGQLCRGFWESFEGWSRYLLSGANNNILIAPCEILYALAFNLLPFLFPFFMGRYPYSSGLLALSAILIVFIRFRINRLLGVAGWWALTHPAASFMLIVISLNTLYRRITGKGVKWKGRIYLEEGRSLFWTGKEYRMKE